MCSLFESSDNPPRVHLMLSFPLLEERRIMKLVILLFASGNRSRSLHSSMQLIPKSAGKREVAGQLLQDGKLATSVKGRSLEKYNKL